MKGFLKFSDDDCKVTEEPIPPKPVAYSIHSHIPEVKRFPGFICSTWVAYRSVYTDFLGWHTTKQWRHPAETSPSECKKMRDSRMCNGRPMDALAQNKWSLEEYPHVQGSWLATNEATSVNCKVEEVALESECLACPINSPIGTIPGGVNGSISHNLVTLIWEESWKESKDCQLKLVSSGDGLLYSTNEVEIKRLQDKNTQTDFLVNTTLETFCKQRLFQRILGMEKVLVTIYAAPPTSNEPRLVQVNVSSSSNITFINGTKTNQLNVNKTVAPVLKGEIEAAAHLQYARDSSLEFENKLAREIRRLQCETRKINQHNVVSTAQMNGWLAASYLDLPLCYKLVTSSLLVSVLQCSPRKVNFDVEITKCGPQPRFENKTISIDGWEFAPYSDCYWHSNFVNFMGKTHAFRNNTWVPVFPSILIQGRQLVDTQPFEADNSLGILLEMHPSLKFNP